MSTVNAERESTAPMGFSKNIIGIYVATMIACFAVCIIILTYFKAITLDVDNLLRRPLTNTQLIIAVLALSTAVSVFLILRLRREISRRSAEENDLRSSVIQLALAASIDGLTGLPDSRAFDNRLAEEWRRAVRSRSSLAVAIIDLDRLHAYNESKGHKRGDIALKIVADCIRGSLKRPGDFVARFGGEEFAILLPDTDVGGAQTLAERIRVAVQDVGLTHSGSNDGVLTISAGAAVMVPTIEDSDRWFIQSADRALAAAKSAGRNRVLVRQGTDLVETAS